MVRSLQACRAAAAALVVLFHLGGTFAQERYFGFKALDGPFAWGDAGVDFFFVLSGFLITAVHGRDFGRRQALPDYLFKRLLRIYPTYWIVCAGVCAAALAVPALRSALPTDAATFVRALLLLPQDPAVVGGTGSPILFVAWSLQYEMLFYAVVAVAVVNRAAGAVSALGLLAVWGGCAVGSGCAFPQSFIGSNMLFLFAMGVGCAWFVDSRFALPAAPRVAALAVAAFFACGAAEVLVGRDLWPVDRRLVHGAVAAVIIAALARAEGDGSLVWRQRWATQLGDASYALYLLHIPLISVLCKAVLLLHPTQPAALVLAYVAIFLACVGASVLFHRVVEKPMLQWFGKRWRAARSTTAAAAAAAAVAVVHADAGTTALPSRGGVR